MDVPIEEGVYIDPKHSVEPSAFGKGQSTTRNEKFNAEGTVSVAGQLRS